VFFVILPSTSPTHDGLNRRIRKTVDPDDTSVDYDYYYNMAWQVLEIRKEGDTDPQKQYIWSVRYIDEPVVRFCDGNTDGDYNDTEDNTLYYCVDANQNVTALAEYNNGSRRIVERYAYDPYGRVTVLHGSVDADGTDTSGNEWEARTEDTFENEVLFCGYRLDPETGSLDGTTGEQSGLYHVRNRIYLAMLGRWGQRDPEGYGDGMGLYEYCSSSVGNLRDPTIWLEKGLRKLGNVYGVS